MSLVRIAVRIAAVEALRGRTLAGDNILDSEIGALDVDADGELRTVEDRPFVTVYTDAATTKDVDTSLRSMVQNGATQILFEAGITAAMTETDPDTDESRLIGIGIPATDRAFEFHLDMVARQIGDALTDPENEWAQIFSGLIQRYVLIERARTSGDNNGVRLAAQQIKLTVDLIADPVKGEPLRATGAFAKFLAKADTIEDQAMTVQIAAIRTAISGAAFDWQIEQRRYGMTGGEMNALLLMPQEGAEADVGVTTVDATPAEPVQP
ncbi:hypothetical protein FJ872_19430 [Mesorhizobium sp. B2-5-9]|uniref:hypothetical protein n=1 Tax=Mesorhizobium sp. B2-5-9 TaxID=2589921 RepID=UPI00112EDDCB|nr:hypothetical protein [Mesorhizobium sp. B2-5-9]TPK15172.1 hypothetical protein FJ872_19430 [Mesorhizobium sp. B2-5-9]